MLSKKIITVCLCMTLLAAGFGTAFALENDAAENMSKDENVYVLADASGKEWKIIVSDWIRNAPGSEQIDDKSGLSDIENVKGVETFLLEEDDRVVWDAGGNDIYYQGYADQELPVGLRVTYQLDGIEMAPEEMIGKSGRATIRFDYDNRQYETVEINGEKEELSVPFIVLTGTLLDNSVFRNVEVTNGKLINDGDRSAAVGFAFPGLQENLPEEAEKLNIPDYFEINADVVDFSFGMTVTVATNEIFDRLNISENPTVLEIKDKVNELLDSLNELSDGMEQLYDGTEQLLDGCGTLSSVIGQLSEGLNTLAENNDALNDGARQVFESLLNLANEQIEATGAEIEALTIENYDSVLESALEMTSEENVRAVARQKVEDAVRDQESKIRDAVTDAVHTEVEAKVRTAIRETVMEQVASSNNLFSGIYSSMSDAQKAAFDKVVEKKMDSTELVEILQEKTEEQMESEQVQDIINTKTEEQIVIITEEQLASEEVQEQIREGLETAASGAESLRSLREQLNSYNTFYQGLLTYTGGVAAAAEGAEQINAGIPELVDGVRQLRDGTKMVVDGLSEADLGELDINGIADRLKAIEDAAKQYYNFSGISDEMGGRVRFIYRTDAVE